VFGKRNRRTRSLIDKSTVPRRDYGKQRHGDLADADPTHFFEFLSGPRRDFGAPLEFGRINFVHDQWQDNEKQHAHRQYAHEPSVQLISILAVCLTNESAKRLGANPVKNMALVKQVVAKAVT
jgi:hypothetical protein